MSSERREALVTLAIMAILSIWLFAAGCRTIDGIGEDLSWLSQRLDASREPN